MVHLFLAQNMDTAYDRLVQSIMMQVILCENMNSKKSF